MSGAPGQSPETRGRDVLLRVLGFLGGIFVFAGVGVFIALQWSGMNSASRVIVTLGTGLAAFVLSMVSARDARLDRKSTRLNSSHLAVSRMPSSA